MKRDLVKEIKELNILGIDVYGGILTETAIAESIDAHRDTLNRIDLAKIAKKIREDEKRFARND